MTNEATATFSPEATRRAILSKLEERGMSRTDLADATGMQPVSVTDYLTQGGSDIGRMRAETLFAILRLVDIDPCVCSG